MLVLNALGQTPISPHKLERRAEPKKLSSLIKLPRSFHTSLATISSFIYTNGLTKALTYEEAVNQSMTNSSDFNNEKFLDGFVKFGVENPLVVGGAALVLAVPLILLQVLKKESKNWGVESAKIAFLKLGDDVGTQLLDIREGKEFREVGSPDVKSLKKKAVAITYSGEDNPRFLKKLGLKFKDPGSTTLFILDKFDGNSELVAELVTANGFKAAYAIKGGADGPEGWKNSGLPWSPPKKAVDLIDIKDAITGVFIDNSDGVPVTLGLAAATGLGFFAFTEIETVLQLLGSAAIIRLVTKKLLFAEDRKATLQQINEFLNTKIAPQELIDEIKMIGNALLPAPINSKSLPAPAQPETSASATPVLKADTVSDRKPELKEEAPTESPPDVISLPNSEVGVESRRRLSRPLSPYPNYPDFKPPSSPCPSKPC